MEVIHSRATNVADETPSRWCRVQSKTFRALRCIRTRGVVVVGGGEQSRRTIVQHRRRRGNCGDVMDRRARRALQLTQWGELSSARQALEGALVAPGNERTRTMLSDPSRRPPVPRAPVAREFIEYNPEDQVVLDGELLSQNLRKSRRGAAVGPSGLTGEHLQVILDSEADSVAFCEFARVLAVGEVPPEVMKAIRLGKQARRGSPWHCGRRFSASSGRPHTGPAVLPGSVGGNFSVPIRPIHQGRNRGRDPRVASTDESGRGCNGGVNRWRGSLRPYLSERHGFGVNGNGMR